MDAKPIAITAGKTLAVNCKHGIHLLPSFDGYLFNVIILDIYIKNPGYNQANII